VKKKNIIIALITLLTMLLVTLTFLFYVFKEVNYDKDDFKLSIKSLFKKELSLNEMKNSNLYKAYEQINYDSDLDEINNTIKRKNDKYIGPFETWDFVYGSILLGYNEYTEPKVRCKSISFATPYTIKLGDNEMNLLFECKSFDEIVDILGEPPMHTETYNKEGDITECIYEWGIKAKYFEPISNEIPLNFPLPYKRKFRVNVDVIESNLIHKLSIEKY